MATWTVYRADVSCGACPRVIPPMQPVCQLLKGVLTSPKLRCVECAAREGFHVDDRQVDDARFEIEREQRVEAEKPLTPAQYVAQASARVPARRPKPFAALGEVADGLPFDPKAAAANDR